NKGWGAVSVGGEAGGIGSRAGADGRAGNCRGEVPSDREVGCACDTGGEGTGRGRRQRATACACTQRYEHLPVQSAGCHSEQANAEKKGRGPKETHEYPT